MNNRQAAAAERARKALVALDKVGLTTLVDQFGSLFVAPAKKLGEDVSTFAVVQDHGDGIGGARLFDGR